MSELVKVVHPIYYSISNANKDIGNIGANMADYVKKETLEIIIESLVSDEELAEALKDYVNKVFMNNALDDYVTKTLFNETNSNFTTYAYVQDIIDNVATITDQMLAIEDTLTTKANDDHTHTLSDITNFATGWQKLFEENYISPVNTITYDSSTMSLNSVFNSINVNSITLINDYPNKFWMTALFKLEYSRSFAIAITKYSYYNKYAQDNSEIRVYFNDQNSDTDGMRTEAYHTLIDSNNYSNYCANKSHTHTLKDITNYTAPDLSPYALKSEIPDISGKANLTHTHILSDITNYTAPDLSPYALKSDIPDISGKANLTHTHTLTDITNYVSPVNTINYDSSTMSLNSIFSSMPDGTISLISNYPTSSMWCSLIAKANSSRSLMFSLTKGASTNKYHPEAGFRVYFNAATSGNEEYSSEIYFDVLTSNNYSNYCANKSHTHTLSDITDFATGWQKLFEENYTAPNLSPYALKSEIPDISGKANLTHTHTLSDITDFTTGWQKLFEENYTAPDLSLYALKSDIPESVDVSNKANKTHYHKISDVAVEYKESNGEIAAVLSTLQDLLNEINYNINGKANAEHQHGAGSIIYAQLTEPGTDNVITISVADELDNRAFKTHTHTISDISDFEPVGTIKYINVGSSLPSGWSYIGYLGTFSIPTNSKGISGYTQFNGTNIAKVTLTFNKNITEAVTLRVSQIGVTVGNFHFNNEMIYTDNYNNNVCVFYKSIDGRSYKIQLTTLDNSNDFSVDSVTLTNIKQCSISFDFEIPTDNLNTTTLYNNYMGVIKRNS